MTWNRKRYTLFSYWSSLAQSIITAKTGASNLHLAYIQICIYSTKIWSTFTVTKNLQISNRFAVSDRIVERVMNSTCRKITHLYSFGLLNSVELLTGLWLRSVYLVLTSYTGITPHSAVILCTTRFRLQVACIQDKNAAFHQYFMHSHF